jgi:large subunit ribosomal protein L20
MPRVKRGVTAHARHKRLLNKAKGYYGARSRIFRAAKQAVIKAGQYAYIGRKQKKRQFRALWITRINAAVREHGLSYNKFIRGLALHSIVIDRKVLADLAVSDKLAFAEIVAKVKSSPNLSH